VLERDPKYAEAWAVFAVVHMRRYQMAQTLVAKEDALRKQEEALDRALAQDPDLAEAHAKMARIRRMRWDFAGAERSMKRALELAPSSPGVISYAAGLASTLGRLDEAIALERRGQESDPLDLIGLYNLGFRYLAAGRTAEAAVTLKKLLELNPQTDGAQAMLGDAYLLQGRAEAALAEYEKETDPSARLAGLAQAQHALGHRAASEAALRELVTEYGDQAKVIATVYAYRGEPDRAFEWLERAYQKHDPDLVYLKPDYFLARLHDDPRWGPLLKKMGLPLT
jgi:tetratricopeptide (TPR) repeat protein